MDDMTPEEIIAEACGLIPPFDFPVEQIMEAFARHGKIIVDRAALKNLLQAQVRSDKLTDQIIDELTTDTGS